MSYVIRGNLCLPEPCFGFRALGHLSPTYDDYRAAVRLLIELGVSIPARRGL